MARRAGAARVAPAALVLLLAGLGGCGTLPPAGGGEAEIEAPVEAEALLLLMVDRQLFDPFTVRRLATGPAGERAALALALGRVGDPRGRGQLELFLGDRDSEVRARAAFALGQLGDPRSAPALLRAARHADTGTGRWAIDSLARLEVSLRQVEDAVAALAPEERRRRLLPPLFRFSEREIPAVALPALAVDDDVRRWAAYALARKASLASRPAFLALLEEEDAWLRGWGARALGAVGTAADLPRLTPLLEDAAPGPVIQALRAGRALIESGRAAPSAEWRAALARRLADSRPGVRLTAIESAAAVLPDPGLGPALAALARVGAGRPRQLALAALAAAGHPEGRELTRRAARSTDPALRAAAAAAAGVVGEAELLERLAHDEAARVRGAALAAQLEAEPEGESAVARRGLGDPDPGLRAAALAWLIERPSAPLEELVGALGGDGARRLPDLALNGARAIAARGRAESRERGRAVELLEGFASGPDWLLRREAARLLAEMDRPEPPVGTVGGDRPLDVYRDLARRAARDPEVELITERGRLTLRLFCSTAPLTCVNFLQLAAQGFYDGLLFHRVVPDFVVQTGDPRGDGWGGPGYTLRDENGLVSYTRGTVGMALSGPDTGGSQFFITLSDQPHLDGSYPAFGRVVSGHEVLDQIVQGDRVVAVRELD